MIPVVHGEDFCMQNPNLQSEIENSFNQTRKFMKNEKMSNIQKSSKKNKKKLRLVRPDTKQNKHLAVAGRAL